MKPLFYAYLLLIANVTLAQIPLGVWHGKLYNTRGSTVKYISVRFTQSNNQPDCELLNFNRATNEWEVLPTTQSTYAQQGTNGVLSTVSERNGATTSEVLLFSSVTNKRLHVAWVQQLNEEKDGVSMAYAEGYLAPYLGGKIYENLSIGGTSTNRISIDKVEVAEKVTVVTFSYHNTSHEQVLMRLAQPGSPGAYYITPPDRSQKYYIVDKDNIAFEPDNTAVPPNSYHTFKIYFEAIPATLTNFSILEGDPGMQTGQEWNFYDIQLK